MSKDVEMFRLQEAYRHASAVLAEMKRKTLTGRKLKRMKTLEQAVSELEVLAMIR